jgi:glycosyltransferase involved in cell wall biosynthesis
VLDGVTGLVVAPDATAVADGLVRLLDNDLRHRMGAAARARAETEFCTRRLVTDHESLYERLVATNRQPDAG